MARRREDEELEVFSFSFLDVLACSVGALAFILLMILFQTRDLVEKSLVEEGMKTEAELRVLVDSLYYTIEVAEKEINELKERLEQLNKERDELQSEVLSLRELSVPLSDFAPAVANLEVAKKEVQLMHSADRRVIACGGGKVLLGAGTRAIDINDRSSFIGAVWLFMEYYDQGREQLWLVEAGKNEEACTVVRSVMQASKAVWGQGLTNPVEKGPPGNAVVSKDAIELDTNQDGAVEVRYIIAAGEETWSRKMVDRGPSSPAFEETWLDYDAANKRWRQKRVDTDGDGVTDVTLVDKDTSDGDFEVMQVFPAPSPSASGQGSWGYLYEDTTGNGRFDKKVVLKNGKQREAQFSSFEASHKRWERMLVDASGDGRYDGQWKLLDGDF